MVFTKKLMWVCKNSEFDADFKTVNKKQKKVYPLVKGQELFAYSIKSQKRHFPSLFQLFSHDLFCSLFNGLDTSIKFSSF